MRRTHKIATTALAASVVSGVFGVAGASAEDQYVEATIVPGISVAVDTGVVNAGNLAPGATPHTVAGGTLSVEANADFQVDVAFDHTSMRQWDAGVGDYAAGGAALTNPITLTATPDADLDGLGVGVGTATSADALGDGTPDGGVIAGANLLGLVGQTIGTYGLSFSQTIDYGDAPGTYRILVTYTGSTL